MKLLNLAMAGAVISVLAGAGSASAGIYNTATQTLTWGPQKPTWTHTFSFSPFVAPLPVDILNSVHISITGTQTFSEATIYCIIGPCTGDYALNSTFKMTSSPLPSSPSFGPLVTDTSGAYSLAAPSGGVPYTTMVIPAGSASSSLSYYNTVTGAGGTLNPSHFTSGPVKFTFSAKDVQDVTQTAGVAGVNFSNVKDFLQVSLYYDYSSPIPEPAGLIPLAAGLIGLAMVRRRRNKA